MIGMRSRSWRRTELTKRSATAFARTGVVMILMSVPGAAAHDHRCHRAEQPDPRPAEGPIRSTSPIEANLIGPSGRTECAFRGELDSVWNARSRVSGLGYPCYGHREGATMTNASGSDENTDKAARAAGRSANPGRREVAPGGRGRRVPGAGKVVGAATSGTKNVVGGVRRAPAGVAERGRAASGQATRAATGAVGTGRTAADEVTRRTADAAETGRAAAGEVASTGADVISAVGSTLRTGIGASLSFVIPKALLLLQLIRRLALMALEALRDLARRLRELATSASRRPDQDDEGTEGSPAAAAAARG
jgi:hypothetical protein